MKKSLISLFTVILLFMPNTTWAEVEEYKVVSELPKENITLYAKKNEKRGMYEDFKIYFKGETYFRPFWVNVTNRTYAPEIYYEDINHDGKKELIITLTRGYGTGVLDEEVYVYRYNNGLVDELVDNPLAIIHKNVKTNLTAEKAEVIVGDKKCTDSTPLKIKPENLFDNISFGSIIDYEVKDNQLIVTVAGQISPASFVGGIVIVYEYRDNMYQAKSIEC
jgi:hypothetical protein